MRRPDEPVVPVCDCRVCGQRTRPLFRGSLLGHRVAYFECPQCGYVQTESPFWLEQAYAEPINRSDTGLLRRNARNLRVVIRVMQLLGCLDGRVTDWAGGYGLLVRMLRDAGVQARWHDEYCQNLLARGFEDDGRPTDLVTGFEVMEHFVDPRAELAKMMARAPAVLVSTDLIATPAPPPGRWWYYAPEHGQHIGFYRRATLEHLARHFERHLSSDGRQFHLFTERPVPAWRWRLARATIRLAPIIARTRLRTLVWDDHRAMSDHDGAAP